MAEGQESTFEKKVFVILDRKEAEALAEELLEYCSFQDAHSRHLFDSFKIQIPQEEPDEGKGDSCFCVIIRPVASDVPVIPVSRQSRRRQSDSPDTESSPTIMDDAVNLT